MKKNIFLFPSQPELYLPQKNHDPPSDMATILQLPLRLRLLYRVNGEPVEAELVQVQRHQTVTELKTPSQYKGYRFRSLHAACHFLIDDKASTNDFVTKASDLPAEVVGMCECYGQVKNPRFREQDPSQPLYVEIRLLMYLEYMQHIVLMPDPKAVTRKHRQAKRWTQRPCDSVRTPATVLALNRQLDVPNFRWGRRLSEMHFRHVSELPEDMNKRCALDIEHVSGYKDAVNCLRRTGMSALIVSPKDFFAAYWLPWQLFSNHADYALPLPEEFPQSGVVPLDIDWDKLTRGLDSAWEDMLSDHRMHVYREWLTFSANRCNTGPELMEWWARDFGKACPQAKDQAVMALHQRAKTLQGKVGHDNWLMGELQRNTVTLMDKVKPQPEEDGEPAWIRLMKEALTQSVADSRKMLQATSNRKRRRWDKQSK